MQGMQNVHYVVLFSAFLFRYSYHFKCCWSRDGFVTHHSLVVIYRLWCNRLPLRNIADTRVAAMLQGVNAVIFF